MTQTRHLVLGGAGIVGVATAATSAYSLFKLAQLCGIPGPLAAALPIALDASAAVAALVWITEKNDLRRWGRAIAIAALGGSLAGNGVQHALTAGLLPLSLPLVLAVGATIPASLWATVHLAAMTVQPSAAPPTHRVKRPAGAHDTGRALAETPAKRTPREPLHAVAPVSTAARAREWIREQLALGRDLTGADVDRALDLSGKQRCGNRELAKVLAERERTA